MTDFCLPSRIGKSCTVCFLVYIKDMIEDIDISSDKFAPIQKGEGVLLNLADFNVVVGKNSSGKTRLFQAIENEYKGQGPTVIYIKAQEMVCGNEFKSTSNSSLLVKKLAEISTILGIKPTVPNELSEKITYIISKTNDSFQQVIGNGNLGLSNTSIGTDMEIAWAVRSILPSDLTEDLEKEGQGYQRLIIALFIKECLISKVDVREEGAEEESFLVLFEEPEICLHSELKRALKSALIEIAKDPKFQVVISTHDPFFAAEINEGGRPSFKRYSLVRDGDVSEVKECYVYGAEDELMHIFLYNKITQMQLSELPAHGRQYKKDNGSEESLPLPKFIRHQIHHLSDNQHTVGLIESGKEGECSGSNYYTEAELRESIEMMCKILYG